jgi:UDP-N-acetylglucosamine 4,6-dehydratase/5-epimerase
MSIRTLVEAVAPGCEVHEIGIRPGEKLHEVLISEDESRNAQELEDMFVIAPSHPWWKPTTPLPNSALTRSFRYASDTNGHWITAEELQKLAGIPAPEEVTERSRAESLRRLQAALGSSTKAPVSTPVRKQ